MNFSPEMLNGFKNMINPDMIRSMGDNVNGMSDDQLRTFLASMGNLTICKKRNGSYFSANISKYVFKYEKHV